MVGVMVIDGPLRNFGGILETWYLVGLICLIEPDPNPQSCDTDCSQSQGWGHQGCLGHFQEGQKGHYQIQEAQEVILRCFHNFRVVDLPLVKSVDGLSIIGLQSFHCILTQQFKDLRWQVDWAILRGWMPRGKGMDLVELIRRKINTSMK